MQDAEKYVNELKGANLDDRSKAIDVLSQFDQNEIVDFLIKLLNEDNNRLTKEGVCKTLGKIGDKRSVDVLIKALRDEHESVRYQAAIALGKIQDKRAIPSLLEILTKKDDPLVRSEAAKAVGLIGDPSALKILLSILKNEEDRFIKYHSVTSLGKIGDKKAIKELTKIAKESDDERLILRSIEAIESIQKTNKMKISAS